jgi:excisionase family DNA binding protein
MKSEWAAALRGILFWLPVRTAPEPGGPLKNTPGENNPVPQLLTIGEVARILKISVSGIRRLQQQRRIVFFKVGGSIRFARRDVVSYLEQNRVDPPAS